MKSLPRLPHHPVRTWATGLWGLAFLTSPACGTNDATLSAQAEGAPEQPQQSDSRDACPADPISELGRLPAACVDPPPTGAFTQNPTGTIEVELGVIERLGDDLGEGFAPLGAGCSIPIAGVGQAGLTARFSLRAKSDPRLEQARVTLTLLNFSEPERGTAANNEPNTLPLDCQPDGWCYITPLRVEISHLNRLPALEGTLVTVALSVADPNDSSRHAELATWGEFQALLE